MISYGFAGMALVGAVAAAGHYMGRDAVARGLPSSEWVELAPTSPNISGKASLLSEPQELTLSATSALSDRESIVLAKGDYLVEESVITGRTDKLVRFEPLMISPPLKQLEKTWRLRRDQKRKLIARRDTKLAEQACLARAVYFEARSESELGQLAVAQVILNRTKNPAFPKTICGVVYQGADRTNSCQFSFACDGASDNPRPGRQWETAKKVAARAVSGDGAVHVISTATNYHADYVRPRWSGAMRRLIKIGRHIFYHDSDG